MVIRIVITWSQERQTSVFLQKIIIKQTIIRHITQYPSKPDLFKQTAYHPTIRKRRWQHQQVIHSKPIRHHDIFLSLQIPIRICAEFPIRRIDKFGFGPNAACPVSTFFFSEGLVTDISGCYGYEVRRD